MPRDFPKRHIYFVMDGQDINKPEKLKFAMVEVNERLCQFISDKIWEGRDKQDFYVKVELADPSPLMQHEQLTEILHFAQSNVQPDTQFEHSWRYAWTIDGRRIQAVLDLHLECRVVLVSSKNKF